MLFIQENEEQITIKSIFSDLQRKTIDRNTFCHQMFNDVIKYKIGEEGKKIWLVLYEPEMFFMKNVEDTMKAYLNL